MGKATINAAVYDAHGIPAEVLRVEAQPWPVCAPDEVIVAIRAAPINPAGLNQIEEKYPIRFILPATPGFEGAGGEVETGREAGHVSIGARVIIPHKFGSWLEACAVEA